VVDPGGIQDALGADGGLRHRTVNQELLLRNEYLGAENRILRGQIKGRLLLSEGEKATLAEIAQRLGRKALEELAAVAKPDTLLAWYRKLIANKFDGSRIRFPGITIKGY
jgi:putative transposase